MSSDLKLINFAIDSHNLDSPSSPIEFSTRFIFSELKLAKSAIDSPNSIVPSLPIKLIEKLI
jgi:hypothetical protein